MEYNARATEKKWQAYWQENQTFKAENNSDKPKYYVLDMFPYPSGAGLHVGHPLGYIASDIYARYKRQQGFNVLHPMGFDAFGLPAEQYAIETGQHPAKTTEINIKRYKEQLANIGLSFDWSREVRTCDPGYYKWTQWIFAQLFDAWYNNDTNKAESISTLTAKFEADGTAGVNAATSFDESFTAEQWRAKTKKERQQILGQFRLAYLAWSEVNWCPALGTVLANDEVKEGKSERGGHPVERKQMRQWFLRISAYSERMLEGLNRIDWPEPLKEMQRNWIGRSEGAQVFFDIEGREEQLEIFTTRPDTIFGATFMVIAPEHPWVESLTTTEQSAEVKDYLEYVQGRTDVERQQEKKVTGAFTGSYCVHPISGKKIPIYIAEYVLIGYGTGAIMAVPSDDDRDNAFAEKFGIEIIPVVDKGDSGASRGDKVGTLINSDFLNGMEVKAAISAMIDKLQELGRGKGVINYRMRDAGFSRQRYWGEPFPIVYKDDVPYLLDADQLPVELPEVSSYKPTGDGQAPLANNAEWVKTAEGDREVDTMPGYAGSSWYMLRYMDPNNDDAFVGSDIEKYWQDVDLYIGGSEHAVGHLMYSRFWHKVLFDLGHVSTDEPFKKLINQGMIQGKSSFVYRLDGTNTFVSKGLIGDRKVMPLHVDVALVDGDVLNTEGFKKWRDDYASAEFELENGQYFCGTEVEKMSKSKYNVVNPDDILEKYGSDVFRMYEMFLGPIEQAKPWDTKGIEGVARFLKKTWRLYHNASQEWEVRNEEASAEELKTLHKTIKKIQEDTERFSFNTAISALMVCVNELTDAKCNKRSILGELPKLFASYAPHLAEELWEKLGNEGSISAVAMPTFNASYLIESTVTYPVSFNGKVKVKVDLPADWDKATIEKEVLEMEEVIKWLDGKAPKRVIVVPGRIVNLVV